MTPIISPWVFYATYVCGNLSFICAAVVIITIFVSIVAIACGFLEDFIEYVKPKTKRILFIIFSICLVIAIFCPSESTITKMIVAQNVTYERVEIVGDTVEDIYNDIISLVDGNEDTEGE